MKAILLIIFSPFRILAGNLVSGVIFNMFKKYPWLIITLSFVFSAVTVFIFYRG